MAHDSRNSLLWWAGLAFLVLIAAWVVFFVIASRYKVEDVPLPPREAR